jgi:S-adenosyl methyltransferase
MTPGDPLETFRPDIPSAARMYDYYLGGKDNYPADRDAAEEVISRMPPGTVRTTALQNRLFLGRAVRYLVAETGIRQFLDIGAGLPTQGNVHDIARSIAPECRVVYVDHDPVVLAHGRNMLNGVGQATIIKHDLRQPEEILADPELRDVLDLGKPVAVMLVAVLHFVPDEENPRGIIGRLMDAVPPGSYLVISHATADFHPEWDEAVKAYSSANSSMRNRTLAEVDALFAGFELIDPGIVLLPQWHPDPATGPLEDVTRSLGWCGVARKLR